MIDSSALAIDKSAPRPSLLAQAWPALLPALALALRPRIPEWGAMWLLGYSIFLAFKILTLRSLPSPPRPLAGLAYATLWVGMDAERFLRRPAAASSRRDWLLASLKTFLGVALVWGVARLAYPVHALLGGWTGIVGLGFILHFGGFHLLALAWQAAGFDAVHIMKSPLLARSVGDFWSARWNLAFRRLAHDYVFVPISRRAGARAAELAAFVFSGLLHEAVISVPARGGYGLPMLYFLIQWLGAGFERSPLGRRLGLRQGWRGRLFAWLVTAAPAFILFHPPFVLHVILPFLRAVGALR